MFAPLHTKSEHSLGLGTAPVEALLRRAADYGYPALALTDVENLYGQVRFHHAAHALGVQPITGVELRAGYGPVSSGSKAGRLVLLARDREGYQSLCRIITRRRAQVGEPTEDPIRCLEANPRGVFFLSDDVAVVESLLRAGVRAGEIRFLADGGPPIPRLEQLGVGLVASVDAVMLEAADHELHLLLAAIRQGRTVRTAQDTEAADHILPAPPELARRFGALPDAIAESLRLAEACSLDLRDAPTGFPRLELPGGESPDAVLERSCRAQLGNAAAEYRERLEHELRVLRKLGFAGYFLVVAEIANYARRQGIALAGRGSAASSLVAFLLGLSTVDPLRHGLCFERFVHPERRDLPDIDLDLASDRRDEVIDWVFRRFGAERVAMVAAHQTFGRRAAYREGLKALGMSLAEVNRFCAQIPEELEAGAIALPPLPPQFRNAAPLLERLIGRPQHLSVHPGGVVLAEPRIECYAPLERAPKGVPVTQYDMTSLEKLGLIKLDLLGNRALAAMQEAERWIQRQRSTVKGQPEMPGAQIASRPSASRNDQATLALLRAGNTVGCFQIETPAMRSLLRKLPVRGIEDLIATLALVRPGPASGEAKAAYIRRAHGEEPATPPHPRLAERLSSNYGMLLFEEDLMAAIAQLTGWPLAQADEFRAALIAADPGSSTLAELERRFVTGSTTTEVSGADALRVWRILERFAAYSFNKAHAASYAQLAWQAAFLKAHHPLELACGVLNSYGGQYPLRTVAADFARCGVRLLAPHVNRSETPSVLESGALRLGLGGVKFLTGRNRERIRELRPFADLADLLHKVPLPYRELEALVLSGACDGLAPLAAAAYPFPHEDFLARWQRQPGAAALDGFVLRTPAGAQGATYRALVRCRNELGFLGMHPSEHPLRVLREEARRQGCLTTAELPAYRGETIRLAALVAATRRLAAARGRGIMQFVTLEDEHGLLEAVLRPGVYASLGDPVTNPGPLLIGGKVEADHGDFQLVVTEVTPFHSRPAPYGEFAKL